VASHADDIRFDEPFESRPGRREGGEPILLLLQGIVVVRDRTDRNDIGDIAGRVDG
jgi:hypothetical protein